MSRHTGADAQYQSKATEAAMRTLLWTESDGREESLEASYGVEDFTSSSRKYLIEALAAILENEGVQERIERNNIAPESFGQDFILTANGHGEGFWSRGYGKDGEWLTGMSLPYREINLYVNGQGLVSIRGHWENCAKQNAS